MSYRLLWLPQYTKMEITLDKFRCYDLKRTFNFPNNGLVLLQGLSGSGKTSILQAISFCLFGTGNKIISFGCKKCEVKLTFDGETFIRTKGPNRLLYIDKQGCELEDDAAQEYINNKFGTNFSITSYITQKGMESFFCLGSAERMEFLEKIALGDVDIAELKRKCKTKIRERKERHRELELQLTFVSQEASKVICPGTIPFPLGGKPNEVKIKNEAIRWKRNTKELEATTKELCRMKEEKNKYETSLQIRNNLLSQLSDTDRSISTLTEEMKLLNPIYEKVEELEEKLKFSTLHKTLISEKTTYASEVKQYEKFKSAELKQMQEELEKVGLVEPVINRIEELQKNISVQEAWKKLKIKLQKTNEAIDEFNSVEDYTSEIAKLREEENKLHNSKAQLKASLCVYRCPSCQTFVKLNKEKLEVAENCQPQQDCKSAKNIDKELEEIQTNIREFGEYKIELLSLLAKKEQCEKELSSLENKGIQLDIDYSAALKKHREELFHSENIQKKLAEIKENIEKENFSLSIKAIQKQINKRNETIKQLERNIEKCNNRSIESLEDSEKLQEDVLQAKLEGQRFVSLDGQLKEKLEVKKKLDCKVSSFTIEEKDYPTTIQQLETSITKLQKEEENYKARSKQLDQYKENEKQITVYKEWQEKLTNLSEQEKNARTSWTVAEKMLKKILEAESKAVEHSIENINNHMRYYLDRFFTDPISVEIKPFKETKAGVEKPCINIAVGYKGSESDINLLSGGERARVELAICLSINSMIGGKLLLLDECLSSLDAESLDCIIETLREEAKEKLIITVLHNAPEGVFDAIVSLQ